MYNNSAVFSVTYWEQLTFQWALLKWCWVVWFVRNSEIYNHEDVKAQHLPGVRMVKDSKSDSAIIGHLYQVQRPGLS